jgi:transmembrane sensor
MTTIHNPGAQTPRDVRRAARAEAAAWIVRLHGPHRSPELEAGFRAWLAADAENARQFERVTEVWDAGATLPTAGLPRVQRWRETSASHRWALAASVVLAVAVGAWAANDLWLNPSYATRLGEQRVVRLDDGSRVALNSGTRIRVNCCEDRRHIRLERGEAYFEVARDPARPFTVVAGDHQVTALGTAFVVRHEASRTAVTLVEGKVAVSRPGDAERSAARALSPGQRMTFTSGAEPRLDEPRIDAVTAWRRGEVVLDHTTLADAAAEMNRYDERLLVIDDPAVAALRISGTYPAGESTGFASTVARLYGLDVVLDRDRIHLAPTSARLKDTGPASPGAHD